MKVKEIDAMIADELDYGVVWTEENLCEKFEIQRPDLSGNAESIMKNASTFTLKKLAAYSSINERLLQHGKCMIQDGKNYRVPLISEMTEQIDKYYKSSNNKYKRAETLRKSFSALFPVEAREADQSASKSHALQASVANKYTPLAVN